MNFFAFGGIKLVMQQKIIIFQTKIMIDDLPRDIVDLFCPLNAVSKNDV